MALLNRPVGTTIQDMIRPEQKLLPELQPYTQERAEKADRPDPVQRVHHRPQPPQHRAGFRPEKRKICRRYWRAGLGAGFDCEIVAFRSTACCRILKADARGDAGGAHYVGGLDPTSVDGAMEKSLDTMFQIALDYDKGWIFTCMKPETRAGRGGGEPW